VVFEGYYRTHEILIGRDAQGKSVEEDYCNSEYQDLPIFASSSFGIVHNAAVISGLLGSSAAWEAMVRLTNGWMTKWVVPDGRL
jgi:hypothetical protein